MSKDTPFFPPSSFKFSICFKISPFVSAKDTNCFSSSFVIAVRLLHINVITQSHPNEQSCFSASLINLAISSSVCEPPVMVLIAASARLRRLNPNILSRVLCWLGIMKRNWWDWPLVWILCKLFLWERGISTNLPPFGSIPIRLYSLEAGDWIFMHKLAASLLTISWIQMIIHFIPFRVIHPFTAITPLRDSSRTWMDFVRFSITFGAYHPQFHWWNHFSTPMIFRPKPIWPPLSIDRVPFEKNCGNREDWLSVSSYLVYAKFLFAS